MGLLARLAAHGVAVVVRDHAGIVLAPLALAPEALRPTTATPSSPLLDQLVGLGLGLVDLGLDALADQALLLALLVHHVQLV
eukprot:8900947-Alexandrium_andersonii.AAC.1